ncbi:MAG: hypothetical protein Q8L14_19405 [Myxococcales bacterium]|nr:hypothetical protein [Myxococcales bacterium]
MIEQPALASRILRALVPSLVAVIAICLLLISMWPDRRYAPNWPYRLALFNGRPTIEGCDKFPPRNRVVISCGDLFDHRFMTMDLDLDEDGAADHRVISRTPDTPDCFELGAVPMPIPTQVLLERTTASRTGRMLLP